MLAQSKAQEVLAMLQVNCSIHRLALNGNLLKYVCSKVVGVFQEATDDREAERKLVTLLGFDQFTFIRQLRQNRQMSASNPDSSMILT